MTTTVEYDAEVRRVLREGLPGVGVHEDLEPDDAKRTTAYVVMFGQDLMFGEYAKYSSVAGQRYDAAILLFGLHVSATTPSIRNKIVAHIRELLRGRRILDAGEIRETGDGVGYGDTDSTMRPTRYTYYLTFRAVIDLGEEG